MKVLFFSHDNYNGSGAFISLVNLANILKNKYNVDCLIILPHHGNGEELLEDFGLNYKIIASYDWITKINYNSPFKKMYWHIKKLIMYFFNIFSIAKIKKIIKEYNPDIVHINTLCTYVGAIASNKLNKPIVWHIREFLEEDWGNEIYFPFGKYKLINKSKKIICITDCIYNKFSKLLKSEKMLRIYNGVKVEKYTFIEKNKSSDKINILCVGSLLPQKGQELIIRALPKVINNINKDIRVFIVGTGKCEDELNNLSKELNIQQYISFEGYRKDTERYYQKSDITIVPSYFEPFGRVTVEAMLCGSFVIGSDTAGTKEIISNNEYGALFKNGDYEDLAEKLIYYIKNDNVRKKIVAKARKNALEQFNAEKNAADIFDLYKKII